MKDHYTLRRMAILDPLISALPLPLTYLEPGSSGFRLRILIVKSKIAVRRGVALFSLTLQEIAKLTLSVAKQSHDKLLYTQSGN